MASDWYIQHGGKQYGPMSAANLKKLAAERKITPATQVRAGAEGAWVQAAQVKGLFTASTETAPKPAPTNSGAPKIPKATPTPPTRAVPKADPLAPPLVTPTPPASAGTMAPPPWARSAQASQATPESPAMAGKILGAVAIILGAVALATFWLPVLNSPVGWTGIVVGGLGLIVGILGLVVAGMSKGSGLILNVAGTSGSAVGLVLAVVLGVTFGLFSSAREPPRVVVERPALPPVEVPKEEPPPPKQPEPEPEPEPVWTDAAQPIEQPPISARVAGVAIEQVRLESTDLSTLRRQKPQPMLKIRVTIANTSSDKIVEVPGWIGGGDLVGQGVAEILGGDAGKAVKAVSATATLTDNVGNPYKQTPMLSVFGAKIPFGEDHALRPGQTRQAELVFPPPLESVEYLRLELSAAGFSGSDALRFQIPRSMITGLPAPAGG
jgi:hypothetical protein